MFLKKHLRASLRHALAEMLFDLFARALRSPSVSAFLVDISERELP